MADAEHTLEFRKACIADLPVLIRNETRSYAFPWTEGVFRDCLNGPQDCWVALAPPALASRSQSRSHTEGDQTDDVVGHAILSVAAGEAHLLNVCISRDRQGYGLGRQFMRFIVRTVQASGAEVLFLEVRPTNRVAISLYESMGFREIGVRKDYYPAPLGREDALVLALQFPPSGQSPATHTDTGRDHFGAV